jgi:hypothetical protein
MSATRRTAARGSTRVHRNVARGALVGVGLLVATGSGTPAAGAATDTPPDVGPPPAEGQETVVAPGRTLNLAPVRAESTTDGVGGNFGYGKPPPPIVTPIVTSTVTVTVTPDGPVPPDLDRSGGTFSLTDLSGEAAATCSTDAAGLCSIATTSGEPVSTGSQLQLSPGLYEVTQTAASVGLLASDRPWYLMLCGTECPTDTTQSVPNTSLFRQHLSAHVVSAGGPDGTGAGAAVTGASYRLAGPDYPRTPAVPGDDGRADGGTSTSDTDGVLTFGGWFLPGTWTVRSVTPPAGYVRGAPATIDVPSTAPDASRTAWGDDLVLTPGDTGSGTEGSGATGSPAPRPDGAGTGTGPGAGTPQAAGGQPAAPASQAGRPESLPASEPTTGVPAPAPPVGSPATQPPLEIASAPDVVSPRLAPASSSFVEVGVIGFGILFVALAVIGVGVLRRRVRDRG